jgi:hypothetical protein
MKSIIALTLVLSLASIIPTSFAWDGMIALDANERNVVLGQVIKYKGYLYGEYPLEDQNVLITVYDKETKDLVFLDDIKPSSKSEKYFENTAWPFTFDVSTFEEGFSLGRTYVVEAMYDDKSSKLEFFIQLDPGLTCFELMGNDPVFVQTNKQKYDKGDVLNVNGCLSRDAATKEIHVTIYDPQGEIVGTSAIKPKSDRTFSENFAINDKFGKDGAYSVEIDAGGVYYSSSSFVVPEFGSIALIIFAVSFVMILVNKRILRQFSHLGS